MTFEEYISDHRQEFESRLFDILRIPSVSAVPAHKSDMLRAADWFMRSFADLGLKSESLFGNGTAGHPMVYAESPARPGTPTILVSHPRNQFHNYII